MSDDWQPIETAPKDGSEIMLWDGIDVCVAVFEADPTFDDFRVIADEDEGKAQYEEWLAENRGRGWMTHEPWTGDYVELLTPIAWQHKPEPPKDAEQ